MKHHLPFSLSRLAQALLVCAGLGLSSGVVFASGSDGGGGAETGDTAAYNMGKGVYAAKLACASCPLAGKRLDAALAKDILMKKPDVAMTADEMQALTVYLKRRFDL